MTDGASVESNPRAAVAIVRGDRMGDVILSSMIPDYVRRFHTEAPVYFWIRESWMPLFAREEEGGRILALPTAPNGTICRETLAQTWRTMGVGTVIMLEPDTAIEEAARLAEVSVRMGFKQHRRQPLTQCLPYTKKKGLKHESDYAYDLLELLGIPKPASRLMPVLSPSAEARESLQARLQSIGLPARLAIMHTGAHPGKPRIPTVYFTAVAQALHEQKQTLALIGAEPDPGLVEILAKQNPPILLHDLGGKLNLGELAWLLKDATVFFARDTGPAHLAAAIGCPTVVLFAQPSPGMDSRRWRPLGPRVTVLEKPLRPRPWENRFALARRHFSLIPPNEAARAILQAFSG
jgi:ADP-heptose:LPS heptosyltransferase